VQAIGEIGGAPRPEGPVGRRVLVVDDSRLQRRVLAASLTRWGYDVVEADSGEAALEACREAPPDLVISDWMMPGMSGPDFCRAFRALGREDYAYFILLTSKDARNHVAEGLDSGADDFLTKPVGAGELRARLNAGERLIDMQREVQEKNRIILRTLDELQALYDSIDNDLIEARKLQQSLLREKSRDFGAAQVALTLSTAGRVGGDLVGFFPAGADQVGLFAIDVSGHGISSAMLTARLAGYLSANDPDRNVAMTLRDGQRAALPPVQVARRLNRLAISEMETGHYFTLVHAVLDLPTGRVSLVQAGHPHPLVQRADGRVEEVGAGGLPIGLLDDADWEEVTLTLAPGDRLVIVSDGAIECPAPHGGMVGEAGLKRLLSGLAETRGEALLKTLIWLLGEINPGPDFPDDISAIVLEYPGPEG